MIFFQVFTKVTKWERQNETEEMFKFKFLDEIKYAEQKARERKCVYCNFHTKGCSKNVFTAISIQKILSDEKVYTGNAF